MEEKTITLEEQQRLAEQEETAKVEKEAKRKAIAEYMDLSIPPEAETMDLHYDNGERGHGRMVIVLGTYALHMRHVGWSNGKVYDELLGLAKDEEIDFDVMVQIKRENFSGTILRKNEIDWNLVDTKPTGEPREKYAYDVLMPHTGGTVEIRGVTEQHAKSWRKIFYNWCIYETAIKPQV